VIPVESRWPQNKAMKGFLSDWWEAFVISWSYGMGDPLAPSEVEGNSGGGRLARQESRWASPPRFLSGFTRP